MGKIQTKTKVPRAPLRSVLQQLPSSFSGRKVGAKSDQYRRLFLAVFTEQLFAQIHAAYVLKSRGQRDDLGEEWKPLAESTIRRKLNSQSYRAPSAYDSLSPRQSTYWKTLQTRYYTQLTARGMKGSDASKKSRSLAWQRLRQTKFNGKGFVPIGIEKGDLIASVTPGRRHGSRYYPPPTQIAKETQGSLTLGSLVKHASHFHRRRRIWPSPRKMQPWIKRAAAAALTAVAAQLAQDTQG